MTAMEEAKMSKSMAINAIDRWFHEVCSTKLLQTTIRHGGPGKFVQIGESPFRHKPKV